SCPHVVQSYSSSSGFPQRHSARMGSDFAGRASINGEPVVFDLEQEGDSGFQDFDLLIEATFPSRISIWMGPAFCRYTAVLAAASPVNCMDGGPKRRSISPYSIPVSI